jgi:hypothetical protein
MTNRFRLAMPWSSVVRVRSLGCGLALLAAMTGIAWLPNLTATPQAVDRSRPPRIEESAGGFSVRRLTEPVVVDGRTWIAVESIIGAQTVRASNGQFSITLEEASSVEVVRFRISFTEGRGVPVQVDPGTAVYAFITPDSRWIITGTLEVIDVRNWRKYSLSKAFNVEAFVGLRAISADGRRLFVSQRDCPFDCRNVPEKFYEIQLPPG